MPRETVTGYCWPQSVEPGGRVALHLSSSGGRRAAVEVARIGRDRTVVLSDPAVEAGEHATPVDAFSNGCGWPEALGIDVDPSWRSGYYEVTFEIDVAGRPRRDHAFFVVRPQIGASSAPRLLVLSTNTWHAYNDFGGRNLYTGATTVSLQRPMSPGYLFKPPGAGRRVTTTSPPDPQMATHIGYLQLNHLSPYAGSAGWPDWELPFVEWAEREGYAFDVATNADLEDHPELLSDHDGAGYRMVLSVGHDEYWTREMFANVRRARDAGVGLAFLSGNSVYHRIDLRPGGGRPHRVFGRVDQFADERDLMGATSYGVGMGDWVCRKPGHWLFAGTGMREGDRIPQLVGWEYHGYPTREGGDLVVVATGETKQTEDPPYAATVYTAAKGNVVFNAATCWWNMVLSTPPGFMNPPNRNFTENDPRVQRITSNLLKRMISGKP